MSVHDTIDTGLACLASDTSTGSALAATGAAILGLGALAMADWRENVSPGCPVRPQYRCALTDEWVDDATAAELLALERKVLREDINPNVYWSPAWKAIRKRLEELGVDEGAFVKHIYQDEPSDWYPDPGHIPVVTKVQMLPYRRTNLRHGPYGDNRDYMQDLRVVPAGGRDINWDYMEHRKAHAQDVFPMADERR